MKISVVIPTKNRSEDLIKAVSSVITQDRLPDELIVIDQSERDISRVAIEGAVRARAECMRLIYIYDPLIRGLVDAKRAGVSYSSGDVVSFLEDDVILETDYLEQIEQGFADQPEMVGCCGIVTNMPSQPFGYEFIFHLFHCGIFRDKRVGLFGRFNGRGHRMIASEMLSGGLSAWRREVFSVVSFDVANGFHMLEDIDFSTRVAKHYGPRLYINPNARLEHHCSPVNRETLAPRQRRKLIEYIVYYKKRRDWPGATFALPWLLLGLFVEAMFQALSSRSFSILRGYFAGMREGFARLVSPQSSSSNTRSL